MVAPRNPTRDEQDKHRRKCWHTALLRVLAAANLLAEAIEGLEGTDAEHQVVRAQDAADFLEEATGWIERGKGC
ncbi:MAG: hypothetical protein M5U26_12600 [Planctomycetota bacterium]|nr:hypothetical protein [Planctomycetota bacterium]